MTKGSTDASQFYCVTSLSAVAKAPHQPLTKPLVCSSLGVYCVLAEVQPTTNRHRISLADSEKTLVGDWKKDITRAIGKSIGAASGLVI